MKIKIGDNVKLKNLKPRWDGKIAKVLYVKTYEGGNQEITCECEGTRLLVFSNEIDLAPPTPVLNPGFATPTKGPGTAGGVR